ncbi:unnamed protein product [Thlaspi arvense]|uniref:Agenet domain-containing protein n=1 Tax=Thlaspi arvense TaxID=13288 RepID=A0AAU9T6B2_THLAR|nr:unnamed protein product [Thlaspi arvense]
MTEGFWRGGDRVEVLRLVSGAAVYFPASVVNASSMRKNLVWVEHESLMVGGSKRMKEYVHPTRIRPSPPPFEISRSFVAGDEVDVFIDSEGFWVRGKVTANLGNSKYIVRVKGGDGTETEANRLNLRLHREWEEGNWVPSLESKTKTIKLKIKFRRRYEFEKGSIVEVRSKEETFNGSWFCARIVSSLGDDRYIVEHLRFKRDGDDSTPLRDLVQGKNMRPVPPLVQGKNYEPGEEVDAWFNQRWWVGRVSTVVERGSKFLVYFISSGEEPTIPHFNLRPHKEWINGQWTSPNKEDPPLKKRKPCERAEKVFNKQWSSSSLYKEDPPLKKLKRCEIEEKVFSNGTMVEVRSDEQGYEGSWYTAKIISYLGENRYRVEYQTLTTEDLKELLKEEARGSDIRPNPPQSACDRYELNQPVDAWYNDGWWSGRVYKINSDYTRYVVYFETTDERFVFGYNDIRPCHVWSKGKWSRA